MPDEIDGTTLVAPLRDTGPEPVAGFSIDRTFGEVRMIRRRRVILTGMAAVVVAALAVVVPTHLSWFGRGGSPYSLSSAHVTASMYPVTIDQANALMPDHNAPEPNAGGQLIAGSVRWTPPRHAADDDDDDDLIVTLYLIDKRTNTEPVYWCGTSDAVSISSSSVDNVVARRYRWLAPVGDVHINGGWTSYSSALNAPASLGSITFIAVFLHSDAGTAFGGHYALAPISVDDLTLAVVYHDSDGHVYWVDRALG